MATITGVIDFISELYSIVSCPSELNSLLQTFNEIILDAVKHLKRRKDKI